MYAVCIFGKCAVFSCAELMNEASAVVQDCKRVLRLRRVSVIASHQIMYSRTIHSLHALSPEKYFTGLVQCILSPTQDVHAGFMKSDSSSGTKLIINLLGSVNTPIERSRIELEL